MKELFQKIDFFEGLEDKILKQVADAAILRQYSKDEMVVRQGETGLGMYIISRGRVAVEREQGGAKSRVAELGPEEFFAEMALLDNKPRSANVITLEDTECLLLTRDSFVKLMRKYPEIPIRLARVLADRLRAANEAIAAGPAPAKAPVKAPAAVKPAAPPAAASAPAAAEQNGSAPAAQAEGEGTKQKIQDSLLSMFESLYTMKAFTRFSVAVLGCPVEGSSPSLVEEIRLGDVKALLVPAGDPVRIDIAAREPGSFELHVFSPGRARPLRYGPVAIEPRSRVWLALEANRCQLHHEDRLLPPAPRAGASGGGRA